MRNGRGQVERIPPLCVAICLWHRDVSLADHRSVKLRVYSSPPHSPLLCGKNDFYYARCLRLINIGPSRIFSTLSQFLLLRAIYAEWLANGARSPVRRLERAIYLIFSQVLNHVISVLEHSIIIWFYMKSVSHVIWLQKYFHCSWVWDTSLLLAFLSLICLSKKILFKLCFLMLIFSIGKLIKQYF